MPDRTMTQEAATDLRKPFPRESIGKLPKGGAMLDYVGHAAVTDRLLTVDPLWSWEPMALDDHGLPALDRAGNLWIRLTILGVTRIGVGDGKSAKECIGDAIRNAAMRFGVALDLWAKENLVEFEQAVAAHKRGTAALAAHLAPTPVADAPEVVEGAPPVDQPDDGRAIDAPKALTQRTRGRLFALLAERGIDDADEQRAGFANILGRPIASRGELTEADANAIIAHLTKGTPS